MAPFPLRWLRTEPFLLACLVGIIPAFVTNTLPTSASFPGVEGFRWASFDLGAARYGFALVLVAAFTLGVLLRRRLLMLGLVPLLALTTMPMSRVGAAAGYDPPPVQAAGETDWSLAGERAAVAAFVQPSDSLDALIAHLPPDLPDNSWLETKLLLVQGARSTAAQNSAAFGIQIGVLRDRIVALRNQPLPPPLLLRVHFQRLRAQQIAAMEAQIKRLTDEMNSAVVPAQTSAAVGLSDLRASIHVHGTWIIEKRAAYVETPYLLASGLLLIVFVWKVGVGNWVMASFILLATAASVWSVSRQGIEDWLLFLHAALYPIFIGLVSIIVMRVLFRAFQDNRQIWRSFAKGELRRACGWALLLWSPFMVVFFCKYAVGDYLYRELSERIYCQHPDTDNCVPPDRAVVRDSFPSRDTLREDLHLAVGRQFALFEERALGVASNASSGVGDLTHRVRAALLNQFNMIIKPDIFGYEGAPQRHECDLLHPLGCIKNIPLDILNAAYQRPRNRMFNAFDRRVTQAANEAVRATTAGAEGFNAAIREQRAEAARVTIKYSDAALLVIAGVSAFLSAIMVLVGVRALLVILARVLFPQNEKVFATITHVENVLRIDVSAIRATIPVENKLHVRLASGRLLLRRRVDVDGAPPNTRWMPPQPWQWPLRRIRNRAYWIKEIDATVSAREITLRSVPGKHYFCLVMPTGTEAAFRWDRFAGMSETVQLKKTFSLKLGSLVLGRVLIPSARGPGLLVLHSYTNAEVNKASIEPARLVAWTVGTEFRVTSSERKKNVYVDPCQVLSGKLGMALHEAAPDGESGTGLWKEFFALFKL